MNRRSNLLLAMTLVVASVPATASDNFDVSGSVWFNEGTESPSMCMKLLPDGRLVFEGGYLFYNPSYWARSSEDPEFVNLRLGGKAPFPTFAFKDQLSRTSNQGLVSFDEKKRLLTYRMAAGQSQIEFMTFLFDRQERCTLQNSPPSRGKPRSAAKLKD